MNKLTFATVYAFIALTSVYFGNKIMGNNFVPVFILINSVFMLWFLVQRMRKQRRK